MAAVVTLPFDVVKTHRQIEMGEAALLTGLFFYIYFLMPPYACAGGIMFPGLMGHH